MLQKLTVIVESRSARATAQVPLATKAGARELPHAARRFRKRWPQLLRRRSSRAHERDRIRRRPRLPPARPSPAATPRVDSVRSICFARASRTPMLSTARACANLLSPRPVEILAFAAKTIGSGSRPSVGARDILGFGAPGVVVVHAIGYRLGRLFYPVERGRGRHGVFFLKWSGVVPRKRRLELWCCTHFPACEAAFHFFP